MANDDANDAAKELARPASQCGSAATAASCARAGRRNVEPDHNAIYFRNNGRHRRGAI
jgi:hypothetical protein